MKKALVWIGRIFIFGAVVGLVAVVPWVLQKEAFFRIDSTEIAIFDGDDGKKSEVPNWLKSEWSAAAEDLRSFEGKDLWNLNMDSVMAKLKARKWVRDVQVTRSWPKKLYVEILPKTPVAYLRGVKGALQPILDDGEILEAGQMDIFMNLPLFSGDFKRKETEKIREAIALFRLLPNTGALSVDRVSEVGYEEKEGFWFLVMPFGTKVRIGNDELERKISRARQVMEYLDSRQIGARVIDADLSKKVVVRLRKTP